MRNLTRNIDFQSIFLMGNFWISVCRNLVWNIIFCKEFLTIFQKGEIMRLALCDRPQPSRVPIPWRDGHVIVTDVLYTKYQNNIKTIFPGFAKLLFLVVLPAALYLFDVSSVYIVHSNKYRALASWFTRLPWWAKRLSSPSFQIPWADSEKFLRMLKMNIMLGQIPHGPHPFQPT